MTKYLAVITTKFPEYIRGNSVELIYLEKHMCFPAEVVADEVTLSVYSNRSTPPGYKPVCIHDSSVRLIKLGSTKGSERAGPELHDFVQVVGRKLGGIVTKYSAGLFFIRFAQSEIPVPKSQLTYDDDRGVWYYSEE